jgi:serine protease Do
MRARALLASALLAALVAAPVPARAKLSLQEVVLRTKPATVLVVAEVSAEVTMDCGGGPRTVAPPPFRETGTGWFIDSNGWVITNGHVVQPAHQPPPWVSHELAQKAVMDVCVYDELERRGIAAGARPDLEDELRRAAMAGPLQNAQVVLKPQLFVLMANAFRLVAKVEKYSPPVSTMRGAGVMSGRDLALLYVEAAEMPAFKLAQGHVAKIGDPIHILGYPGVVLTHELLNSTAKVEASVTNGAISGFKQDVQNNSVIQTDAPAAWGNSGGPAVDDEGNVVGVLTFVSLAPGPQGSIVQGFNFVIPAEAVREFLRDTKVDLADKSPFNEHWFAGLRRFFSDDWRGAVESIKAADRLQPEFPDLRRLLAEAEEQAKKPRPFPWPLAVGAVLVVGAGGVAVAGLGRARARGRRVSAEDLARLEALGAAAVLLDVREAALYTQSPYAIPGSLRLDPERVEEDLPGLALDQRRLVVAYSTSDEVESLAVTRRLRARGYANAHVLRGGLGGWVAAGLPLASKTTEAGGAAS